MFPRFSTLALAAAALITVSYTQTVYEIDPESVPLSLRENWCMNSERSCPLICSQYDSREPLVNSCDPEALTYGCLCGNNVKPNMSEYSLTIPYFTCQEWGNQCVDGCNGDAGCATSCREDNPCGAQDPERVNLTSTSTSLAPGTSQTSASTTDDGTTIFTNTPGGGSDGGSSGSSSGDDEGAASLLTLGSTYGLTVVMGGMFLGFALF